MNSENGLKLFHILRLELPSLAPTDCKVHLAGWNGRDDPLDIFLAGDFPAWQNWQGHKNFERQFVVSLIKLEGANRWLFAGVFSVHGCDPVQCQQDHSWFRSTEYSPTPESREITQAFRYQTRELLEFANLTGRLVVTYERKARQPYRLAETCASEMEVGELLPRRLAIEEFPGYRSVLLSKAKLDLIVMQEIQSWKGALSSVAGVYLITDSKTGRHYVGSAYGIGGIWARWVAYSRSGDGGDKLLNRLLQSKGHNYCSNFQFAILETADTHTSKDDVLRREKHWKDVLCSRESHGGYNAN